MTKKGSGDDQRLRSDLIIEFQELSKEFAELGGAPDFLRYAWTRSLLAQQPSKIKAAINAEMGSRFNGPQIKKVQRAAQSLLYKLRTLDPELKALGPVSQAIASVGVLGDLLGQADKDLRLPQSVGPRVEHPWRYYFFAAIWPHLAAGSKSSVRSRWSWLQQWFDAGDSVTAVDASFTHLRVVRGGLEFRDLMAPAFAVRPMKGSGNWETARGWWKGARGTPDISLRLCMALGAGDYLVWRHRLFKKPFDPLTAPKKFTATDIQFARAAQSLLDEVQLPSSPASMPGTLLGRCLQQQA